MFKSPNKWLLLGASNYLSNFSFFIDSYIVLIQKQYNTTDIKMIYKNSLENANLIEQDIQTQVLLQQNIALNVARRINVMESIITVSFVVTNPDTLNHLWDYRWVVFYCDDKHYLIQYLVAIE